MRKKTGAPRPTAAGVAPRDVAAAPAEVGMAPRRVGYPVYADLARGAVALGALAALVTTAGCRGPTCQSSRWGELRVHGESAVGDAADLRVLDAAQEMGVSLGIVPHPAMALPGAMPVVVMPPPPVSAPTPDADPEAEAPPQEPTAQ